MKLMMYPETPYEEIKIRFGMEGIEPPYILQNVDLRNPDSIVLTIVINVHYPPDIIHGGRYLNPRIFRMLDDCFNALDLFLIHLGDYPNSSHDNTSNLILPIIECEWINDSGWYLLIDRDGNKQGELKLWDISDYYGDFYGEAAALFVSLPKEQNFQLKTLVHEHCGREHIGFTEHPEVHYKKVSRSFREKIRKLFTQKK